MRRIHRTLMVRRYRGRGLAREAKEAAGTRAAQLQREQPAQHDRYRTDPWNDVPQREWDRDLLLLAVENGVIDLRTGQPIVADQRQ